jgi:hypothetical protein
MTKGWFSGQSLDSCKPRGLSGLYMFAANLVAMIAGHECDIVFKDVRGSKLARPRDNEKKKGGEKK